MRPNMGANRGANSWVGYGKLGCEIGSTGGVVLLSRRTLALANTANSLFLKRIKGWASYSLPGVFGAPPLVSQLAILATSSMPCSLGFPSSFVRPNSLAC
jgi:hypothetical protein